MANRPTPFGLTREAQQKVESKYNDKDEQSAIQWIRAVLKDESILKDVAGKDALKEGLKSGVILCSLMQALEPFSINKIHKQATPFKEMENIGQFLDACQNYGLQGTDIFQTVDLYEGQNMAQVVATIHALGRKARKKGFKGPGLGPKESTANPREFSEEKMVEGKMFIGLQYGTNKGASQAGMNFGLGRQIKQHENVENGSNYYN